MIDYYTILGVSESASASEIKATFKKLAVQYHPDKHEGSPEMEERFKEINQAYQILSNPYEKARYDLRRQGGQSTQTTYTSSTESYYSPPPPPPRPRSSQRRPKYTEPPINWKENWRATGYAFGFTFIVAAIVMTIIGIFNYVQAVKLEELLAARRAVFEEAKTNYQLGRVEQSLQSLDDLNPFLESETDMQRFTVDIFASFYYEAENSFENRAYEEAIYYYELLENYGPRTTLSMKERLARAYRGANQPEKSIKKIKEMLLEGYRQMELYVQLAEIHRDMLNDPMEARRYYEIASDLAIKQYESIYGNAYPLVLQGKFLPREHFALYTGLASIYLETGEPERAIKATRWNTRIWPDSLENYLIAARGFETLGDQSQACANYQTAVALGHRGMVPSPCAR